MCTLSGCLTSVRISRKSPTTAEPMISVPTEKLLTRDASRTPSSWIPSQLTSTTSVVSTMVSCEPPMPTYGTKYWAKAKPPPGGPVSQPPMANQAGNQPNLCDTSFEAH